jgi:hypothetical protein
MQSDSFSTIGDIALRFGIAEWQARRAVDALGTEIPRAGLYRLVPHSLFQRLEAELKRRGYLKGLEGHGASRK